MKSYKQNNYENKRLETLERLEKKENSVLNTKSNINSTLSRITDNFNTRFQYAQSKIYQQTEVLTLLKQESENYRIELHDRILNRCIYMDN